jgi:hypothetical protein
MKCNVACLTAVAALVATAADAAAPTSSASATCPFGAPGVLFEDSSGQYQVTCINNTAVHIVMLSVPPGFDPLDGAFDPTQQLISATFSNSPGHVIHGQVATDLATIAWDNGAVWQHGTTSVHVVYMTHLDLGACVLGIQSVAVSERALHVCACVSIFLSSSSVSAAGGANQEWASERVSGCESKAATLIAAGHRAVDHRRPTPTCRLHGHDTQRLRRVRPHLRN